MDIQVKKQVLFSKYLTLMIPIYCGYAIFYYFLDAKLFTYLILSYCTVVIILKFILRNKIINVDFLINLLIITGSLLIFYIVIRLWFYTTVGCLWLFPIPLIAKLFLRKEYFKYYNFYIAVLLIIMIILGENTLIDPIKIRNILMLRVLDITSIIYNIFFVSWILHNHEKITNMEYVYNEYGVEEEEPKNKGVIINKKNDDVNSDKLNLIFLEIKKIIEDEMHFKKPDFTLFELSAKLKINLTYVSLAIKHNGFNNFSHYINTCRISKVKGLLKSEDLNKVTLMYIYTSCGFSTQSTFNRVFKQIEGITPTDFLKKVGK